MEQQMIFIVENESNRADGRIDRAVWHYDIPDFDNPDALEGYLKDRAEPGSYLINDLGVWATQAAINTVVQAYREDVATEAAVPSGYEDDELPDCTCGWSGKGTGPDRRFVRGDRCPHCGESLS